MSEYQILDNLLVAEYQKTYFTQVRSNNERKKKKRVKEGGRRQDGREKIREPFFPLLYTNASFLGEDERNCVFFFCNQYNCT